MTKKRLFKLTLLLLFSLFVLLLAPFIGFKPISFSDILGLTADHVLFDIFWRIRMPRMLAGFLAGAGLAISGMAFQALFRNPLATPFTLGVSAGAAFGAVLSLNIGIFFFIPGFSGQTLFAFLGALLSMLLVYAISKIKKAFSTAAMLVAGVAISFFFSSLILFIQYLSDFSRSFQIIRWLMGGIEIVGYQPVNTLLPFVILGSAVILLLTRELNLLTLGEDIAISRGGDINKIKFSLFFATSLMVGSIVAVCGPIGFVGMMAPHICRLIIGPDHRFLFWASLSFGGAFLVLCDTLARTIIAPAEIPVGVITALLGGPFFLWLLIRSSEENIFN